MNVLQDMIDTLERKEFQKWLTANGELTRLGIATFAFEAWRARGAMQNKCRGVMRQGCNYTAACGSICNKCGEKH